MSLEEIRDKIDTLDKQIIQLLEERLALALKTKKYKKTIYDKRREEEIFNKISSSPIKTIYRCIFKVTQKKQKKTNYL